MSAKAAQRERTYAAILGSACELVRDKGIGGTRVSEVMSGVGLTVGGFYAHFASKEALVDAAIRRTAALMRARLLDRLGDKPEQVRAEVVMKRYLCAAHRDDARNGCPLPAIVGEVSTSAPEHREVLAEQLGELAEAIAELVPRQDRAGRSSRGAALAMIALMYGGISLARAVKGTAMSDEILRACRAFGKERA